MGDVKKEMEINSQVRSNLDIICYSRYPKTEIFQEEITQDTERTAIILPWEGGKDIAYASTTNPTFLLGKIHLNLLGFHAL